MIVSKPKFNTLFSISIFLILAFGLFIFGLFKVNNSEDRTLWMILMYVSGPIGLVVMIKTLSGLRYIKISKQKFEFRFPFKLTSIKFEGKDIDVWKHQAIKTYGGMYEKITLRLKSGKELSLSKQENTEYDKALKYMRSKFKKIEMK